jgi:hypothetical protein
MTYLARALDDGLARIAGDGRDRRITYLDGELLRPPQRGECQ